MQDKYIATVEYESTFKSSNTARSSKMIAPLFVIWLFVSKTWTILTFIVYDNDPLYIDVAMAWWMILASIDAEFDRWQLIFPVQILLANLHRKLCWLHLNIYSYFRIVHVFGRKSHIKIEGKTYFKSTLSPKWTQVHTKIAIFLTQYAHLDHTRITYNLELITWHFPPL